MSRKTKAQEFADAGYQIHITGRHLNITDSMKEYAMEKLSKVERFMDRIIDIHVVMDIQKLDHHVEIVMKAGHVKISSHASSDDMYASIDKAVHKLEHQVLKYKSRLSDHHLKNHPVIDMMVDVVRAPGDEEILDALDDSLPTPQQTAESFHPHYVVKQEKRPLKVLTTDEAIMKMDLSGDAFLIYKNEVDLKLKVIYRRKDGHYGIIEPNL